VRTESVGRRSLRKDNIEENLGSIPDRFLSHVPDPLLVPPRKQKTMVGSGHRGR